MRSEKIRRALVLLALPLGVYVLAALIITWPLAARITTHAAGAGWGDSFEVIRHGWWAREALLDGHNPFDQPLLAYPDGFTSWLMASHPLQYLPPALLALVFSPLVAFNLALLSVLVLNGLSAYWLGLHLNGGRRLGALLGGLVFLAFPAVQGHLSVGHLGIVTLWPVPLFTLALWRVLFERAGWRSVIAGGVWFALAALAYVSQITFVLLPLIGLIGVGALLWARRQIVVPGAAWAEQPWLRVLALIALGGLLLVPFYAPLLSDAGRAEVRGIAEPGRVAFSADVLAPVSVSPFGPLDALAPDYTRDVLGVNSAEGSAYLGVIALALAAIAIWRRRTTARIWALVGLGALVLSLGPLLKWRDEPVIIRFEAYESYVPLPWALLQELPLLDATRTPGRFNLATGLALSALVSIGAAALERVRRREAALALAAGLGGLLLVEYQLFWPFLTTDARQPAYFRDLARQDDVRAVLNLPANHNLAAKFALYQQTLHGKPLIAGHALRRTPQNPALLALLEQVAGADAAGGVFTLTPETARYLLSAAGADRVIVHKPFMPDAANALDHVRAVLGAPDYEDEQIAAFVVPRTGDPPPDLVLAGAGGSEGWSAPVDAGPFAGRFLADDGAW
ncbi:MAG: hypothetical protein GXY36_08190, partial [Chloroflexi bacterium]|nr:hypothetical protein [Chloroflexota bacterium]